METIEEFLKYLQSYDIQQLKPINGLPPLLNSCMLSSFVYQRFVKVLRAKDENLQRMQKISRERSENLIANKSAMKQVLYKLLANRNYRFLPSTILLYLTMQFIALERTNTAGMPKPRLCEA
jgi:hypothetical protein